MKRFGLTSDDLNGMYQALYEGNVDSLDGARDFVTSEEVPDNVVFALIKAANADARRNAKRDARSWSGSYISGAYD